LSNPLVLAVHRVLLRTARTPLARIWGLAYRLTARIYAAYLLRGGRGSAYLRGSIGTGDWLPGLADVDIAVVLERDSAGPGVAAADAAERWQALRRRIPAADLVLDYPLLVERDQLDWLAARSALTPEGDAGFAGPRHGHDGTRLLERPGLYGTTDGWRPLGRPGPSLPAPSRGRAEQLAAGWLELAYWWQWAIAACADPAGPRTASLCVKLVCEPARIWLWLAHGERVGDRVDVLRRALSRLPEEEAGLRRAVDLQRALPDSPAPPLPEVLPVLVRLTERVAAILTAEAGEPTSVRLAGHDLVLPHGRWIGPQPAELRPLVDWLTVVLTPAPDNAFAPVPGDLADPTAVGAAARSQEYGPWPAMRRGDLIVLPGASRWRTRLRAVHTPVTAPALFAVADGRDVARFPGLPGWSARDTAARAATEHAAALRANPARDGEDLGRVLAAARAALFREDPGELALTVSEAARRLAERPGARTVAEEAAGRYREWADLRTPPPPEVVAATRELVLGLDALRQPARALAVEP
jgi:Nucleotidyltransferase domain